jgi:hypothetical protein
MKLTFIINYFFLYDFQILRFYEFQKPCKEQAYAQQA